MTLILSGTNGLSDVDGSAATPAIRGTDTNTGMFFPAADTVGIATGGTERLRLDSSGNLGLGVTPSSWGGNIARALQVGTTVNLSNGYSSTYLSNNAYNNSSNNWIYQTTGNTVGLYSIQAGSSIHTWYTAPSGTAGGTVSLTQAMTLDASGNLLVNITSPLSSAANRNEITLNGGSNGAIVSFGVSGTRKGYVYSESTDFSVANEGSGAMRFLNNGSERARITSSGNLLAGTTSDSGYHVLQKGNSGDWASATINTSSTTPQGHLIRYTGASPNNTGSGFLLGMDSGNTTRFSFPSNGGLYNYQANNVNLSDRREKTNFAPAGEYLSKICAIPVQTFNYIDQNMEDDPGLTLGVVAQDVEAVAPELVMETNWGTKEEPKMRLSIYQTDLQYALMKCIQEQQAIITQLQADVAALKGQA